MNENSINKDNKEYTNKPKDNETINDNPVNKNFPTIDEPLHFQSYVPIEKLFKKSKKRNFNVINENDLLECSPDGIRNVIDYHDNMDRHKYKRYGFWLIVATMVAFLLVAILDSFLVNFISEYKTSSITEGFIDLLKYIIPTLIGFVFADTKGNKSKSEDKKR